jgi:hypothetical protein
VMHAHGRLVDVRLERVVLVGEGWDLVGHRSLLCRKLTLLWAVLSPAAI